MISKNSKFFTKDNILLGLRNIEKRYDEFEISGKKYRETKKQLKKMLREFD